MRRWKCSVCSAETTTDDSTWPEIWPVPVYSDEVGPPHEHAWLEEEQSEGSRLRLAGRPRLWRFFSCACGARARAAAGRIPDPSIKRGSLLRLGNRTVVGQHFHSWVEDRPVKEDEDDR